MSKQNNYPLPLNLIILAKTINPSTYSLIEDSLYHFWTKYNMYFKTKGEKSRVCLIELNHYVKHKPFYKDEDPYQLKEYFDKIHIVHPNEFGELFNSEKKEDWEKVIKLGNRWLNEKYGRIADKYLVQMNMLDSKRMINV